jgi:hypothetical protein
LVKTASGSSAAEGAASPPAARNRATSKAIRIANRRFCMFSFTPSVGLVEKTPTILICHKLSVFLVV